MYSPSKRRMKNDEYTSFHKTLGETFILDGDLNAMHIVFTLNNKKSKELYRAIRVTKGKWLSTGFFVRSPGFSFISKNIHQLYASYIHLTHSENVITKEPNPTIANKNTNWKDLNENYVKEFS